MGSRRKDSNGGVIQGLMNLLVLHKAWGSGRMLKEKVYIGESIYRRKERAQVKSLNKHGGNKGQSEN